MSTAMTLEIESTSSRNTQELAAKIGAKLRGGEVIELISDLGGGKTTFVQGLALGMGSEDVVSSPSFTISHEYRAGKLALHHYDFYRLNDPGVVAAELDESIADPHATVVIEWADVVNNVLPKQRIQIWLSSTSEETRTLRMVLPEALSYLVEGLN